MNEVYYGVEPYSGKIICHYGVPDMAWGFSKGVANGLRKAVGIINPQTGEYIYNQARKIGRGIADFYDNVSGNKRRREQAAKELKLKEIKERGAKAAAARDKQVSDLKTLNYYRSILNKDNGKYVDIAEKYDPKYREGKAIDEKYKSQQNLRNRQYTTDFKRAERDELQNLKRRREQGQQARLNAKLNKQRQNITDFKRAERSELQNLKRRREQGQRARLNAKLNKQRQNLTDFKRAERDELQNLQRRREQGQRARLNARLNRGI